MVVPDRATVFLHTLNLPLEGLLGVQALHGELLWVHDLTTGSGRDGVSCVLGLRVWRLLDEAGKALIT